MTIENKNHPAFPTNVQIEAPAHHYTTVETYPGLTKREWFIGMALSGSVARLVDHRAIAEDAIRIADALITALER